METDRSELTERDRLDTERSRLGSLLTDRSKLTTDRSEEEFRPRMVMKKGVSGRMGSLNSDLTPAEWENDRTEYVQGRIVVDGNDLDLDMLREPAPVKQLTAKFDNESFDEDDSVGPDEDESIELDEYLASDRELGLESVDVSFDEDFETVKKEVKKASYTACTFIRQRTGLSSQYLMYLEETGKVNAKKLLVGAKKGGLTSKGFQLFDMRDSLISFDQCSADGPNYMGEIIRTQSNPLRLLLRKGTSEYIAVQYEKQGVIDYAQHGLKLRELLVAMPGVDAFGRMNTHNTRESDSLTAFLGERDTNNADIIMLKPMLPVYHKGSYRLHFLDRHQEKKVPIVPSGKNLQLIAAGAMPHADKPQIAKSQVELEFVKTGKDVYRVQFREPMTIEQAFVIAISQFASV